MRDRKLQKMRLSFYLLPIVGSLLSLWTLSRSQGDLEQREISRLSISVTLIWSIVYSLLWTGAGQSSEIVSFRLLYANAIATSGYFFFCCMLTVRLWQGKSLRLSGISKIADELESKKS
jgi:uncharacterized membrane protein